MKTKLVFTAALIGLALHSKPNSITVVSNVKEQGKHDLFSSNSEIEWHSVYYRGIGVSYCNVTINGKKMHFRVSGKYTLDDFKKMYANGILKESYAEDGWVE